MFGVALSRKTLQSQPLKQPRVNSDAVQVLAKGCPEKYCLKLLSYVAYNWN